jgi:hypothetical protein
MSEPTSTTAATGLVALAVALVGPMAGEYAVIVLSALAGSLWALSRSTTATRAAGALLVLRLVLTAVVLAGGASWWLSTQYSIPAHQLLAPVAFGVGAIGNGWGSLINAALGMLRRRMDGGKP